jgi:hypothetical protein
LQVFVFHWLKATPSTSGHEGSVGCLNDGGVYQPPDHYNNEITAPVIDVKAGAQLAFPIIWFDA